LPFKHILVHDYITLMDSGFIEKLLNKEIKSLFSEIPKHNLNRQKGIWMKIKKLLNEHMIEYLKSDPCKYTQMYKGYDYEGMFVEFQGVYWNTVLHEKTRGLFIYMNKSLDKQIRLKWSKQLNDGKFIGKLIKHIFKYDLVNKIEYKCAISILKHLLESNKRSLLEDWSNDFKVTKILIKRRRSEDENSEGFGDNISYTICEMVKFLLDNDSPQNYLVELSNSIRNDEGELYLRKSILYQMIRNTKMAI